MLVKSCSENDLEVTHPNNLSPETFFQTAEQAQSSVDAVYANLQTRGLYARHMFFMMDNMSHENTPALHLEADKLEYSEFTFNSSHGPIRDYWESCFRGINKANFVIGNEEAIYAVNETFLSTVNKNKIMGEAKFLRALYYFYLVTRFGDVPLIDGIPDGPAGYPRSPASDIYQLIIADLQDAESLLLDKADSENGRANKGAAIALLGKTYLFMGNKSAALTEFNKIYGQYGLEDNYFDNFTEEGEHGSESIFEVEFNDDLGDGAKWDSQVSGAGLNEVTFRGQEYGLLNWFNVYPSDDLLNEYEAGDSRYQDNFYSSGDTYAEGASTIGTGDLLVDGIQTIAGWKKYQNYYKDASEDQASGINAKVIRYADVLLMMAECTYENNPGTAIGYINEVRQRPSVGLTPISGLTGTALFDAIVHERKVELAGEQTRFPDMVRWGIAGQELAGTGFTAGKNELFPIPDAEISTNEAIDNSNQNPGY